MSERIDNWPSAFVAAAEKMRGAPFQWGQNDCCIGACDVIAAITGIDPGADLRGRYTTALGAARVLKPLGGVEQIAEDRCKANGWAEIPLLMAQRGDIAIIDTEHGPAVGVCIGATVLFAGGAERKLNECRRAWRIG
jgi:cell wall-associated NlpC family hydrolase